MEEEVEEVVVLEEEGEVVEEEVEEYQNLISWMKHWILTFRCMPTVRSAQKILFFYPCYHFHGTIQLIWKLLTVLVEIMLVIYQTQFPRRRMRVQTGDEEEVPVVEVGEDINNLGADTVTLGLELLQTIVIVIEELKNYDRMHL